MRIPAHRLDRQLISHHGLATPAKVISWLGAMQAQDYLAALWALGLRTPKATQDTIEAALTDGSIIRTHLLRGTWHYVGREDVRWMLGLIGPRVIAAGAGRNRQLGLDPKALRRSIELLGRALTGSTQLTRDELRNVLTHAGISLASPRLSHILGHAELAGVITSGGRRGKQQTFALLDDRVPRAPPLTRQEALATLARRYFQSRGPATLHDLVWWSGLTLGDAREAVSLLGAELTSERIGGETFWLVATEDTRTPRRGPRAHLLPAFDEYLVGYRDRSALIDPAHTRMVNDRGGMLNPVVLIDGRVIGTWKRTLGKDEVVIAVQLFRKLTPPERRAVELAATRYGAFVGRTARITGVAGTW